MLSSESSCFFRALALAKRVLMFDDASSMILLSRETEGLDQRWRNSVSILGTESIGFELWRAASNFDNTGCTDHHYRTSLIQDNRN